MKTQAPLET